MKRIVCFCTAAILLAFVSCSSQKKVAEQKSVPVGKGDVEVIIPCTGVGFYSDATTFRASGEGFSHSMTTAKNKALQTARERLATSIESTMQAVIDNYASSYETGMDEESKSKYQGLSRTIVNRTLQGVVPICEKVMQTPEGAYRAYVAVEMMGGKILEEYNNSVNKDDKLRIEYEYEKFKQTFDEEMRKLEEKNGR